MKPILMFITAISLLSCSQGNSQNGGHKEDIKVGGSCEGCEAIFESPIAFEKLLPVDTILGFIENVPKMLVTGTVFHHDGKTPAKDVVIYIYHTDREGNYPTTGKEKGWGRRHGYHRGWVKTDEKGNYAFYTFRPASYPNSNNPQHIHVTIKEPGKTAYWIDEYHFEDDPLFNSEMKNREQKRGGSGIIKPVTATDLLTVNRNIILGMNVPGYPGGQK